MIEVLGGRRHAMDVLWRLVAASLLCLCLIVYDLWREGGGYRVHVGLLLAIAVAVVAADELEAGRQAVGEANEAFGSRCLLLLSCAADVVAAAASGGGRLTTSLANRRMEVCSARGGLLIWTLFILVVVGVAFGGDVRTSNRGGGGREAIAGHTATRLIGVVVGIVGHGRVRLDYGQVAAQSHSSALLRHDGEQIGLEMADGRVDRQRARIRRIVVVVAAVWRRVDTVTAVAGRRCGRRAAATAGRRGRRGGGGG